MGRVAAELQVKAHERERERRAERSRGYGCGTKTWTNRGAAGGSKLENDRIERGASVARAGGLIPSSGIPRGTSARGARGPISIDGAAPPMGLESLCITDSARCIAKSRRAGDAYGKRRLFAAVCGICERNCELLLGWTGGRKKVGRAACV